eukprot:2672214-Heterocapsa_arctica.AAC.1
MPCEAPTKGTVMSNGPEYSFVRNRFQSSSTMLLSSSSKRPVRKLFCAQCESSAFVSTKRSKVARFPFPDPVGEASGQPEADDEEDDTSVKGSECKEAPHGPSKPVLKE